MSEEINIDHIADDLSLAYQDGYNAGYAAALAEKDVRPVVHGEWIKNGYSIRCSECGYDMPFAVRNYCPNCGAKTEG